MGRDMCEITVDSLTGILTAAGTPPARILVQGSSDCESVMVTFSQSMIASDDRRSFGPVPVIGGFWTLMFWPPNPRLRCGDEIKINVRCVEEPNCREEFNVPMICTVQPARCPLPNLAVAEIASSCRDGKRQVRFTASVENAPAGSAYRIVYGDGSSSADTTYIDTGSQQWEETHEYSPGTYQAFLDSIVPRDCDGPMLPVGPLIACDVVCPVVAVREPKIAGCDAQGRRQVGFTVDYSGADTDTEFQLDYGDGTFSETVVVSGTGEHAFAAHPYSPPGPYTATLIVIRPRGCAGATRHVPRVETCPAGGDPPRDDDGDGGDDGGTTRPEIPWCAIAGIAALFLIAFGLAMMAFFFCVLNYADWIIAALLALGLVTAGTTSVISLIIVIALIVLIFIGLAIAIAGNILFLLWLLACASCRTNCRLLWNIHWLIVGVLIPLWTVITIIAAIVGVATGGRPCWVGWLLGVLDFGILDAMLLYYGAAVGCFQWPSWIPPFLRLRIPDPLRFICGRGG